MKKILASMLLLSALPNVSFALCGILQKTEKAPPCPQGQVACSQERQIVYQVQGGTEGTKDLTAKTKAKFDEIEALVGQTVNVEGKDVGDGDFQVSSIESVAACPEAK